MLTICTALMISPVHANDADELHELQKKYLASDEVLLSFKQKSYFPDFEEAIEAQGLITINRKTHEFHWNVKTPSPFSFYADTKIVRMKMGDSKDQAFPIESLPEKFKFIQAFFEILGFERISESSWKVKKIGKKAFKLTSLRKNFPIKDLKIELSSNGAPEKLSFKNQSKTKFEILLKKVKNTDLRNGLK